MVYRIRRMSGFAFVILRGRRSLMQCVYSPEKAKCDRDTISEGCSVIIKGEVVADEKVMNGAEVHIHDIKVLSKPAENAPVVMNDRERAILKIQEGIARGFREYLLKQGFTEIRTPKIVFAGAEVTHYPSAKRPFYAMDDSNDPGYTLSFNLLYNGLEVTTGGQRIHDYHQQVNKMIERGMNPDDFESYLMLHKYGIPPHGGLGIGLERLTMKLLGFSNVRNACLFPRDTVRVTP